MAATVRLNPKYESIRAFVEKLPDDFDKKGSLVFQSRNCIRSFTTDGGVTLVVKHFKKLSLFRRILYTLFSHSKARRAFDAGMRFRALGFESPEPVAYIDLRRCGVLSDCYFVSLPAEGVSLYPILVDTPRFDSALADKVAGLLASLHEAGAVHGDPNLNNILYHAGDGGDVRLSLIDTNRSYFRRRLGMTACLKNLKRVTHRRDLLRHIAGSYAARRGLDPVTTADRVLVYLDRFEKNRAFRHRIKALFKRKKNVGR